MGRLILLPLLRALAWALFALPAGLRLRLAHGLGMLLRAAGMRAKVIDQNLALAFAGEDPAAKRRRAELFKRAYDHLGELVIEILMLLGPMRRYVERYGTLVGAENWRAAHDLGRGVIYLASHVGNWEIMAATGAMKGGMDLMLVTKRLKPDWFHRAIEAGRLRCGVSCTFEPRTLKDVLGHLKRGGTVGIVLDQYAGPPVGVRVPVFGTPVGTSAALATLARRTGAVVLPVVNYRDPAGRLIVDIRPPVSWLADPDPTREIALNTARYAEILEKDIYAHPEQWLWTHRRFKGDLSPLREDEWSRGRTRS